MTTKLYIYFKKEILIEKEGDFEKLRELVSKAKNLQLFDEMFILKDKELEEIEKRKSEFIYSMLKDLKYLKEEVASLKSITRKLLRIIYELKDGLKTMIRIR